MATTFFADSCLTIVAYLTPKVYQFVTFDTMSNGKSTFVSDDESLVNAIMNTSEFKSGRITCDTPVKTPKVESVVKENLITDTVEETPAVEVVEETEEAPAAEVETVEFADIAEAKDFLKEKGVKAADIRSVKAIKEQGMNLGYNIVITD